MPNAAAAYDAIIKSVLAGPQGPAGGVEAALMNVMLGAAAAPAARVAPAFDFADNAAIRTQLTNSPANWPVVIKRHLDDFVLPQFQAIPSTPVAGAPGGAKVAWNTPEQIAKVLRNESAVTFTAPATNDFAKAEVSRFDYKLHQLQPNPGGDIADAWQLVKAYTAGGGAAVPASAHASQAAAVWTINQLAAFEGFCIRVAAAIAAAARADVSLAEALALWRTEGDLLVPYSEARQSARAPSGDVIPSISLGANTNEVFATMQRGLWSFTYERLIRAGLPADAAQQKQVEDAFGLLAFVHWSLVAAGLDFFWKQIALDLGDRSKTVAAIADFLNGNHIGRTGTLTDFKPALAADCHAVLNDLVCHLPSATTGRVIVAPTHPAPLVALVLGEALIFAELGSVNGQGPAVEPTPKLKYLAYHCQDHRHRTDVAQDKFTLMLVSAAVAAARTATGALKASLAPYAADATFPKSSGLKSLDFKTPVVGGDTSGHLAAYQKLADGGWWNATNLDNLADFILAAKAGQWVGWDDLRGNMARYQKLRAYYEALLS